MEGIEHKVYNWRVATMKQSKFGTTNTLRKGHYMTLHDIIWHYMTLHDITWHYMTLHKSPLSVSMALVGGIAFLYAQPPSLIPVQKPRFAIAHVHMSRHKLHQWKCRENPQFRGGCPIESLPSYGGFPWISLCQTDQVAHPHWSFRKWRSCYMHLTTAQLPSWKKCRLAIPKITIFVGGKTYPPNARFTVGFKLYIIVINCWLLLGFK